MHSLTQTDILEQEVFTQELAMQLVESTEDFPINFDVAWQWLNYSNKSNAKRTFTGWSFLKGIDYEVFTQSQKDANGGRPLEKILLSVECFKRWALKLNTELSNKLVDYFLECEKIAKQSIDLQTIGSNLPKKEVSKAGFVYLIKAETTSFYKIGKSKDVYKRLETLQTANQSELTVIYRIFSTNYSLLEKRLHKYYEEYWVRGEWFDLPDSTVRNFLSVANYIEDKEELKTIEDSKETTLSLQK